MIRLTRPAEFPWLDGRFWEVPHQLGPDVAIVRVELPSNVIVAPDAVGEVALVRAGRIRDRMDALHFLASHAVLRSLLALVIGESPSRLDLTIGPHGKPRLARDAIRFNMSRSGGAVLIGISAAAEIGVDIEQERELPCLEDLARAHFAPVEYAAWQSSGALSRLGTFLTCWTRKEACAKAAGTGQAISFDLIQVGHGAQPSPVRVAFRSGVRDWTGRVVSLPMPSNLFAAAALVA